MSPLIRPDRAHVTSPGSASCAPPPPWRELFDRGIAVAWPRRKSQIMVPQDRCRGVCGEGAAAGAGGVTTTTCVGPVSVERRLRRSMFFLDANELLRIELSECVCIYVGVATTPQTRIKESVIIHLPATARERTVEPLALLLVLPRRTRMMLDDHGHDHGQLQQQGQGLYRRWSARRARQTSCRGLSAY